MSFFLYKKNKIYTFLSLLSFSLFIFLLVYALPSKASIYKMYASSCLGGWKNAHLVSGVPNTEGSETFNEENSAVLEGNTLAQIFCGGFDGNISEDTIPKKILVKFSWKAAYPENIEQPISVEEIVNEPTDKPVDEPTDMLLEQSVPLGGKIEENEISEEIQQTESVPTPEVILDEQLPKEDEPVSFLPFFVKNLYAAETEIVEETNKEEIKEEIKEEEVIVEEVAYGLVKVSYTKDGVLWQDLGYVDKDDFSATSFEILIEDSMKWEDVSKIQISVEGLPVMDNIFPTIYLDSLWIEAEYDHIQNQSIGASESQLTAAVINTEPTSLADNIIDVDLSGDGPLMAEEKESENAWLKSMMVLSAMSSVQLSERKFEQNIEIDHNATHYCEVSPNEINISTIKKTQANILLERPQGSASSYKMIIGSIPEGIDIKFTKNNKYEYEILKDDLSLDLMIYNQEISRKGNFSIPVLFERNESNQSSYVMCQLNILNEENKE